MNRNLFFSIFLIALATLLVGCGSGSGSSSNPVGAGLVQSQVPEGFIRASINEPKRKIKYSFSQSTLKAAQRLRDGIKAVAARLKLNILADSNNEDITMTISSMVVRSKNGTRYTFDEEAAVSLNNSSLSALLAEKELPVGKYNYIEFKVAEAFIKENGEDYGVHIPFDKLRFVGDFELKDGYETTLNILFSHKLILNKNKVYERGLEVKYLLARTAYLIAKAAYEDHPNLVNKTAMDLAKKIMDSCEDAMSKKYTLVPYIKISSSLKLLPPEEIATDGDVSGIVSDLIDSSLISGVGVVLDSLGSGETAGDVGSFAAVTGADGAFKFEKVPVGTYALKVSNPDYLDASILVEVLPGQVIAVEAKMHPAIVKSAVANTGWFSEFYPMADANGAYGEVGLETPIRIDFVSLAFVRAEVSFVACYHENGAARVVNYLGTQQQVSADFQMDGWWAGNSMQGLTKIGECLAVCQDGITVTYDITEVLKENPSSLYFLAAHNTDLVDIKLKDIQIKIYYK